jgi:hypothetical protein
VVILNLALRSDVGPSNSVAILAQSLFDFDHHGAGLSTPRPPKALELLTKRELAPGFALKSREI